ncbi:Hypothetical protein NTJ_15483 [Nesidiocoris tenuis]|uniref:Uncharacterized protein n=1 Tax=Nesidiocoris tenuis TaxID=355587 RepID=A0ABN7BFM2_9HEMI|nr:Hypothetical protein NTJ_15483 [Nesidiocoris tenuis]
MDKFYNKDNIAKFCERLFHSMDNDDEETFSGFITVLKVLISGPPTSNQRHFYLEHLSPESCIAAVLCSNSAKRSLRANSSNCLQLIDCLLELPRFNGAIPRALDSLISCLGSPLQKKKVASEVFKHPDFYRLAPKTIISCLTEDSAELELTIFQMLSREDDEEIREKFKRWVELSCHPEIFQAAAAILHELLLRLKTKTPVLRTIVTFVSDVFHICTRNNLNPVDLYPRELQSLVSLMSSVDPVDFAEYEHLGAYRDMIRSRFDKISENSPSEALLLSTHFPKWNHFLS